MVFKEGNRLYLGWLAFLVIVAVLGWWAYSIQLSQGLTITDMSKDVSWGLYIANFTFLVGIAASAVIVVLPTYLHNVKRFKNLTIIGELVAISAIIMCMLFVLVDLGRVDRVLNVALYPSPNSVMFFDLLALSGYLLLNLIIVGGVIMGREGKYFSRFLMAVVLLSIPWAISIHTVTAFIYSGLIAKSFWNTAILAPRFLASAFASGPALLILIAYAVKRYTTFEISERSIYQLAEVVAYAMVVNLFFIGAEFFTVFYGNNPAHLEHFIYMLFGLGGQFSIAPLIWFSFIAGIVSVILLVNPGTRKNRTTLMFACALLFVSIWLEKGLALIIPAYVPSAIGTVQTYWPTLLEGLITAGVWATGLLLLSVSLQKVVKRMAVKQKYQRLEE